MEYQNYIFDLYGTLVDIHTDEEKPEVWEKLSLFYGYYRAKYTSEELKNTYRDLVNSSLAFSCRVNEAVADGLLADSILSDRGVASRDLGHEAYPEIQLEAIFQELFLMKGIQPPQSLVLHAGQFFRVLTTEYIRLYEGAKELLAYLRGRGRRVYLLSNAQRIFAEYELRLLGIDGCFDGMMLSSDYGVKKPEPRFFRIMLDTYHLKPEECLMTGNDGWADIGGARGVGIDSCYIHTNLSPENDSGEQATYGLKRLGDFKYLRL